MRVGLAQLVIDRVGESVWNLPRPAIVRYDDVGVFSAFIAGWVWRHGHPVLPTIPTVLKIEHRGVSRLPAAFMGGEVQLWATRGGPCP